MTQLAIDGGTPVRTVPMPKWPAPTEREIAASERVLRSGRLNYWTGDECRLFEAEYAVRLGRQHAVSLANGTLALELALRAFGVSTGDEVIVPARTFIATASAVVAVGATPVVADIDPDTNCLTVESVEAVLTPATRAVIPVHLAGWPVDMPALMELATQQDLLVIEDCAQAHGACFHGREIGSFGHAAAFSFCQDKIITTGGEGGLLVLDDDEAYERAWAYKDHGKSRASAFGSGGQGTAFCWLHESFGSNWRMTEMQAAIGRVALSNLDAMVESRTANARYLMADLEKVPGLHLPTPDPQVRPAYYRLMGRLDLDALRPEWTRDRVLSAIFAEGVPIFFGTCAEIYREHAFVQAGLTPLRRLPGAEAAAESSFALAVHPALGQTELDDTVRAIQKVMEAAAEWA